MKFILIAVAAALKVRYNDLPHTGSVAVNADQVEKLDPLSRYVNDDDLVQVKSEVRYNDLPHTGSVAVNAD